VDDKTAKRIDSLYRNINSFLTLAVLSLIIPLLMLFVVPLSLAYLHLRAKLLRDVDSGKISFDRTETVSINRTSALTMEQKVDFIRRHDTRLWVPIIVFVGVVLITIVYVYFLD
jgi:hypothetical protein